MISFNLILPELNGFITNLGGADYKGLVISIFTISAAISRPFSGKLSDYIGRKKVMYFGVFVSFLVCLLYPLSTSVLFFLVLRFLHGFSAGFMPTGATALVTDLLPANKRGVGMGIWGTFISLGIGVGQGLSFLIVNLFSLNGLFLISSLTAVLSIIILVSVQETLKNKVKFKPSLLVVNWKDVFEPAVLPAAMVMFLSASCSGIIFVLSPDISEFLHLENKGWFFVFYVFCTILVRLFTGKLSDVIGRRKTLIIGMSILIISMTLLAFTNSVSSFTIASIVFGIATGISSPTLFAWTADLSNEHRRGVGAGTMFIALELGIMFGAFSTTLFYNNSLQSVKTAVLFGAFMALLGLIYLFWHLKYKKSIT
jgi:MFS family permease